MRAVESLLKLFIKKFPAEFPSDKCQMATDAANMMISFVELPKAEFSLEVPVEDIASATVKAQLSKKCTKVSEEEQKSSKITVDLLLSHHIENIWIKVMKSMRKVFSNLIVLIL